MPNEINFTENDDLRVNNNVNIYENRQTTFTMVEGNKNNDDLTCDAILSGYGYAPRRENEADMISRTNNGESWRALSNSIQMPQINNIQNPPIPTNQQPPETISSSSHWIHPNLSEFIIGGPVPFLTGPPRPIGSGFDRLLDVPGIQLNTQPAVYNHFQIQNPQNFIISHHHQTFPSISSLSSFRPAFPVVPHFNGTSLPRPVPPPPIIQQILSPEELHCSQKIGVTPIPMFSERRALFDEYLQKWPKEMAEFDRAIYDFLGHNLQTYETYKWKMKIRREIQRAISPLFPPGTVMLRAVGSTVNGCGATNSDLDLCLCVRNKKGVYQNNKSFVRKTLHRIQNPIRKLPIVDTLELILHAKVPILKIKLLPEHGNLEVDINVNNVPGQYNSYLMHQYSRIDDRFSALCLIVKAWAKLCRINDAFEGTFNSYSLILMVLHYLQCVARPSVLPNLQHLYPDHFMYMPIEKIVYFEGLPSPLPEMLPNKQTVGELLIGFFDYYAMFDFASHAISVEQGCIFSRKRTPVNLQRYSVYIEEPFDGTNTARAVRHTHFDFIRSAFLDAQYLFLARNAGPPSLDALGLFVKPSKYGERSSLWTPTDPFKLHMGVFAPIFGDIEEKSSIKQPQEVMNGVLGQEKQNDEDMEFYDGEIEELAMPNNNKKLTKKNTPLDLSKTEKCRLRKTEKHRLRRQKKALALKQMPKEMKSEKKLREIEKRKLRRKKSALAWKQLPEEIRSEKRKLFEAKRKLNKEKKKLENEVMPAKEPKVKVKNLKQLLKRKNPWPASNPNGHEDPLPHKRLKTELLLPESSNSALTQDNAQVQMRQSQ